MLYLRFIIVPKICNVRLFLITNRVEEHKRRSMRKTPLVLQALLVAVDHITSQW